ncbi:uncharacterized protein [Procambarus clarkii]|uniref:uncharacterized protein isoform X2 n=1 Tax=Procambarus clarkii TaxID=6728 RepID=UPI0037434BFC
MRCLECLVVSCVAIGPSMALLALLFYNHKVDPNTFFIVLCITALCCCFTCLWHRWWRRRGSYLQHALQSEEDLESGGADASTGEADSPPKYDSVMAKPPPYDQLYTGDQTGNDSTHDILLDHDLGASLTTGGEKPDASPPSYSEVTKTGASQSLDQSAHQ